jgi:hypothetical protein
MARIRLGAVRDWVWQGVHVKTGNAGFVFPRVLRTRRGEKEFLVGEKNRKVHGAKLRRV